MDILREALKQLNEQYEDDDEFAEELDKVLNDRFLGKTFEIQVEGGGSGPDEWYTEDDCEVTEIYFDDFYSIEISLSRVITEPDRDDSAYASRVYDRMKAHSKFTANIPLKEFKDLNYGSASHEQVIDYFKNISEKDFGSYVYWGVRY